MFYTFTIVMQWISVIQLLILNQLVKSFVVEIDTAFQYQIRTISDIAITWLLLAFNHQPTHRGCSFI